MNKKMVICGLLSALAFSLAGTAGAQEHMGMDSVQQAAAEEPVTAESLQEMRRQLENQLRQAQELQEKLSARLDSLDRRMKKTEQQVERPALELHGYGRLRWDKQHFEPFKGVDRKSIWINLFTKYRINDCWNLRSEHEFVDSLSDNHGAYEGDGGYSAPGGKKYSRPVLQLYAEGRIGAVDVKLGRYYLQSPYKFTFDEKIDGWQASYGMPTRFGRPARFTLNSGNTYSRLLYGDKENKLDVWAEGGSTNFRVLSLIGEIPVAKNTNFTAHYGRMTRRDDHMQRKTLSVGFDTKLNRDLKLTAAMAHSDSDTLNRSHVIELKYKEAQPAVPGSYDIYIKKYLQRGHTGMTDWFNDDIIDPTNGDYNDELSKKNPGMSVWDHRAGEFNGVRIGVDFVPVRNTKLKFRYTFGKLGLFDPGSGTLTGKKDDYSFFRTQWEVYF